MKLKLYVNGSKQELLDTRSVLNAAMKTDQSTSSWAGKANSFHYLRGTTPSYGYFLVHGSGASLTGKVEVEVDCGSELLNITGLQIESSMAVLKGGKTTNSVFLVKVIDPIISNISKNSITKEYNVPIGLKYPKSISLASSKQGSEEEISYDKTTLKEGKEPYTWSEIFTDILKGEGEEGPEIDFEDADFPEGTPQGIRLLHGSSKELLDDLLGKLGLTIIRSRTGSLKISEIDSSKVGGTIQSFSENILNINKFPKTGTQFTNIPSKVIFRFPKVALKNDLGTLYDKVESKTPIGGKYSPIPGTEWSVELPYYSEGTSKEDQEGKAKKGSRKKITETLMRHYDGIWRARTKEYQEAIFHSYLPIDIDKGISEVRWSFTDKEGPKTKISSFPGNEFPENSKETFPREFIGLGVVDEIDNELDTFSVKKINIISGEYKEINNSSASISEVKELFTSQSIHKGDEVILIRNTSSGKIFAFKPAGPLKVVEFALVDKLKLGDARTRAVLVDDYGLPNYSAANSSQKELGITFAEEIYVFDSENERVGRPGEGRYTPVPDKQWSDDLRTRAIQLGVENKSSSISNNIFETDPYLGPSEQGEEFDDYNNRPYKGHAKLITQNTKAFLKGLVPEDVWKDVLPIPGYEIVEMDAPARFLVVEFIKDESKGSTSMASSKQGSNIPSHPRSGLKANILTDTIGTGLPTQGREPPDSFGSKGSSSMAPSKQEKNSSYQLKVWSGPTYDGLDVKAGDIRWVYYNDVKDRYEFFIHDHENIVLIRCSDKLKVIVQNIKISEKKGFLSDHIGKVVRLEEDALLEEDCWTITGVSDCSSGICPTVLDIMDKCDECDGCYKLSDCDSYDTKIIKKTEIGKDEDGKAIVIGDGDVVRLDDGTCWSVSLAEYCESTETVTIKSHATSCTTCDWCYELTRCSNSEETKKIYEDAHEFEIGDVFKINGTCWEVTNEGECVFLETPDAEHISTPTQTYDGCGECGCYKLSPCEDTEGGDLYIDKDDGGRDPHSLIGKVIRTATGGCYTVSESQDCDKLTAVTIQEEFYACGNSDYLDGPQPRQACVAYQITRCDDDEGSDYEPQCTYSDLQRLQGKVVRRAEDGKCYTVGSVVPWSDSCIEVTEEDYFEECSDCTDPKYQLTQCSGCDEVSADLSSFTTTHDLKDAIGKIIKVDSICYSVSKASSDGIADQESIIYLGPYESCKVCNPEEMWVVTNVYEDGNKLRQERKRVIVQQVCDEEDLDIIDIGDCDD